MSTVSKIHCCSLFLYLSLHHLLLISSCGISSFKYRPNGPMMCLMTCQGSKHANTSIKTYHCFGIYKNDSPVSTENYFSCHNTDETANDKTTSTAKPEPDKCNAKLKDLNKTLSKLQDEKSRNNALTQACMAGKICTVKYLLSNKLADINFVGPYGSTPVMTAAKYGQLEVFNFLISQSCDLSLVNSKGDSVLILACFGGNTDIIKKLIVDKKHNIKERRRNGATPVMVATFAGKRAVFDLLVSKGCNLTVTDNDGQNILHMAAISHNTDMLNHVLSTKLFDIDGPVKSGMTAVMKAASSGLVNNVKLLANRGCKLTKVDNTGNNLLHYACYNGRLNVVKYLVTLHNFTGKEKNYKGKTPLDYAKMKGHKDIVDLLSKI